MRTLLCIALAFCINSQLSSAQVVRQQQVTQISPIELVQTNYGVTGYDAASGIGGCFWPRGSNQQFAFGAGLWIGGQVEDSSGTLHKAVFTTFDPNSGKSAATPLSDLAVSVTGDVEVMTSLFTDTVLSAYDYPADQLASRYPMGLEVRQELTTQRTGPYKDVAILSTSIRNIHPTRTIHGMVVDLMIDPDVGPRDNYVLASREDRMEIVDEPDDLGIVLFSTQPHNGVTYGRFGVALVNTPDHRSAATIIHHPIELDPSTSDERYALIASGAHQVYSGVGDVRAHVASEAYTLAPGQQLSFHFLLIFSMDEDSIAIPWMIDVVKNFRTATSVAENAESDRLRLYPNPVNADGVVRLLAEHMPQSVELVDAMGRVVRTFEHDCSAIDVKGLPTGMYAVRATDGARCERALLSIVK
jgi:hypothetical protein